MVSWCLFGLLVFGYCLYVVALGLLVFSMFLGFWLGWYVWCFVVCCGMFALFAFRWFGCLLAWLLFCFSSVVYRITRYIDCRLLFVVLIACLVGVMLLYSFVLDLPVAVLFYLWLCVCVCFWYVCFCLLLFYIVVICCFCWFRCLLAWLL